MVGSIRVCVCVCVCVCVRVCHSPQDHPINATYLGNLAQLEMALGRPLAAEPLLRRALEISTKAFGVEAAETAVLLNSLASLLLDLGKYEDAEKV